MHRRPALASLCLLLSIAGVALAAPAPPPKAPAAPAAQPAPPPVVLPGNGSPADKAFTAAARLVEANDPAGALKLLEPYRNDPQLPTPGASLLGYLYVESKRPQDALAVLEPLTRQRPPDGAVLYNASRAAFALRQRDKGRAWLTAAAAIDPLSPAGRDLGMLLAREGQIVEAYTLLRAWVPLHPRDGDARLQAATLALVLERPLEARKLLEGLDTSNPAIRLLHAKIYLQMGQPQQALQLLEPLLASHPQSADLEVRRMTAQAYVATKQAPRAVALLKGHTGGDPRGSLVLAQAQRASGDASGAIATLEPLVKALPKPGTVGDPRPAAAVALEYGSLLLAGGRAAEAVPPLQRATELTPLAEPAWRQLAAALQASGHAAEAGRATAHADELARALQAKASGHPVIASGSGAAELAIKVTQFQSALRGERYVEAKRLASEMLASSPDNPDFLYQMGLVEMAQKDKAAAEKHFRAAIAANPNHIAAMDDLALLLLDSGRKDEARQLLQKVLALRADDPAALRAMQQLQKPAKPSKP